MGEILTDFESRKDFFEMLQAPHNGVIAKFTATWCGPCKKIAPTVDTYFNKMKDTYTCCSIDVDDNFDLYAFMKSKKMTNGIPTLLYYKKGNTNLIPDASISGGNIPNVENFFKNILANN